MRWVDSKQATQTIESEVSTQIQEAQLLVEANIIFTIVKWQTTIMFRLKL